MTLPNFDISALRMFRAVELILAIGVAVSSCELLYIRDELRDNGWLSWRLHRLSHPRMARVASRIGSEILFRYPGVLVLLGARLSAAVVLIGIVISKRSSLSVLIVLTLTSLLFTLRCPQGNDGSDQMSLVALSALTLGAAVGTSFGIEAQSALSYATSGILKVGETGWRNGEFVTEILKTSTFGNRSVLQLVEQNAWLGQVLGCSVAIGDCVLGSAVFLPPGACLAVLTFGLFLHIGIAAVLGLNTFLWSFVGTYPAVLWVSASIYSRF
jgi:hypothetical protein